MAGIGFELRRLFGQKGLFNSFRAYAYSSMTTVGPMILCMSTIVCMQRFMLAAESPYLDRQLFLATVVYCFIFSVLITGGLSMLVTRYISDMIYLRKYEHLLSSYYGAIATALPIGSLLAWLFLRNVSAGLGYKAAAYLFFSELIIIWLQSVHLSALKDYKRIVRNFCCGVVIAIAGSWLLLKYTPYKSAAAVLTMMDIGFMLIVLLTAYHFEQKFPRKSSRVYFNFFTYFRKYPSLFFIGTFFYSGVYVHSFVYWFSPYNERIGERFVISPFYDLPVFYAYLTVVPTLVTFVVSVETSFYDKFRGYYDKILNGGTLQEIMRAKLDMQRTLMQEVSFMMEVQLLFTVISLALGIKLLLKLGFSNEQLYMFNILVLGYFVFIMSFIIMLIMLYFDDRKGVLAISSLFVLLNAGFTYWFMKIEYHGFGIFIAAFVALLCALARLIMYVRNIDYYTFCAQPITVPKKVSRWYHFRRKSSVVTMLLVISVIFLSACSNDSSHESGTGPQMSPVTAPIAANDKLIEDKRLYQQDNDTSVDTIYLTILPDKRGKENPLTWYAMNRIKNRMDEGDLKVIVQEGAPDGSGPKSGMFGYGSTGSNGKISIRGNTARYAAQRSYKIRLEDQAGLWHDQKTLNLNKHILDSTRIRNKLSFDIFETIPNMTSLRTQFVHLYVKDLSEGKGESFEDYGLFTHIEQPNEKFLKSHWLDPNGQLYKAIMFEFFRYPDELKSKSDPAYNKAAFETRLEIDGYEDHEKLLTMLDDVNNLTIPIDDVVAKHFDLENYLTFLAANILMDNMDTDAQNFFLYSPLNSEKWYFLPWDYDGGWELQRGQGSISPYSEGVSNFWGSVLHNRFFRSEKNVQLLKDKIDELYATINNETVAKRLQTYRGIVEPFMVKAPDINFLPTHLSKLNDEFKRIEGVPLRSLERFKEDIEKPKPFFMGDLIHENGKYRFEWDPSFDLQGDDLTYEWTLAKDPAFTEVIEQRKNLKDTSVELSSLKSGEYFWKVTVQDGKGHQQIAFELQSIDGKPYYGVRAIKVE
ncbi:exopolysaccharide Pel transporter PelG [Paenibacillus roseipurpureus]|uniref:Exopolysaccharide Pel transporter PelG n=1 Tax=Paenibacillus roseopurpureus TaxID=2918901 RepID=A0AA96LKJ0_9BACL|nr:exopolysaccharide Pel transporter PelG [Paenibacillus sp. MBLB1832]WNR42341.1 exopolysaccharide Pel transporter PelG [Paenibacillus sp. MBLB1832]